MNVDYIIVGAGAAGSALANRLSEDPNSSVLVLEAGASDRDPLIRIPKGTFYFLGSDRHAYNYRTLPAGPPGNIEVWKRGRVMGGSTSINGLQYDRGAPGMWNDIAAAGNPGWGWDDMRPVFRTIEDHEFGASPTRGAGGPLPIHVSKAANELNDAIFEAAVAAGVERVEDVNESEGDRIGYMPNTSRKGLRVSAADAFLKPALKRPNLTYQGQTTVASVLFDGTRAVGVRARSRSVVSDYFARKEVILAGGAVESPMLLERSGIGDPEVLHAAGVPLRVESPNVGKRVLEQRLVPYQARIGHPLGGYNTMYGSTFRQMLQGVKYLATRGGFIASGAHDIAVFFKSTPDAPRADVFGNINPITLDLAGEGIGVGPDAGFSFTGYALHPTTEGSVHISGSQPDNVPVIDARFLETDYDRTATVAAIERMREIAAQAPLADLIVEEQAPGPQASAPEDIIGLAWAAGNVYHAVGSAAMGPEDDDVVDATLRVRGTEGLRVADTSVFPINPGNPQGPTMALGWRAADLILSDTE